MVPREIRYVWWTWNNGISFCKVGTFGKCDCIYFLNNLPLVWKLFQYIELCPVLSIGLFISANLRSRCCRCISANMFALFLYVFLIFVKDIVELQDKALYGIKNKNICLYKYESVNTLKILWNNIFPWNTYAARCIPTDLLHRYVEIIW